MLGETKINKSDSETIQRDKGYQANMRRWPNVGLLLGQRRRLGTCGDHLSARYICKQSSDNKS